MTQTEVEILSNLVELENAVAAPPGANPKPDLLSLFSRLDALTGQLPSTADPLLLHYLHKKSYQKARLFLQGRDAENAAGNCRGHVDAQGNPWPARNPAPVPPASAEDPSPPAGPQVPHAVQNCNDVEPRSVAGFGPSPSEKPVINQRSVRGV